MRRTDRRNSQWTRRMALHGTGVTMLLPWLESVPVWGDRTPSSGDSEFPKRFATLFMACGIHPDHWWAKGSGADMELSRSLKPLDEAVANYPGASAVQIIRAEVAGQMGAPDRQYAMMKACSIASGRIRTKQANSQNTTITAVRALLFLSDS